MSVYHRIGSDQGKFASGRIPERKMFEAYSCRSGHNRQESKQQSSLEIYQQLGHLAVLPSLKVSPLQIVDGMTFQ